MSLERIEGKIDKIVDTQIAHGLTLERNTVSLDNHMARTEINERRVEKLEYTLIGIAAIGVMGGFIRFLLM